VAYFKEVALVHGFRLNLVFDEMQIGFLAHGIFKSTNSLKVSTRVMLQRAVVSITILSLQLIIDII